jgi:beta-N-acetylhexosaminidase
MLFKYNLDTDSAAIRDLLDETRALIASENNIPPFVAIDHEGGEVNRFRRGFADLPSAASYRELALTDRDSAIAQIYVDSLDAGKAMSSLGINLNLVPVAEYLNNDNSDFLEDRSYGTDPDFTAEAAAAFIAGMEQAGIRCVVKHFPGSAGPDPHRFPSVLTGDKAALNELVSPVAALIRGGQARVIMVSHSAVPVWDSVIASLSPKVMGLWLRQELGFDGIIICDDFSMASAGSQASAGGQAAASGQVFAGSQASAGDHSNLKPESAAVLSLAAGADMVLVWPPDLRRTHRAILAALDDGRLPRERLRKAAERIIFEKARELGTNER